MILHLENNPLTHRGWARLVWTIGTLGWNILNYILASGQILPNNCYLCKEGRKRATQWRADMLPCPPDISLSLQCPSLLSVTSARCWALPQQGVTLFEGEEGGSEQRAQHYKGGIWVVQDMGSGVWVFRWLSGSGFKGYTHPCTASCV